MDGNFSHDVYTAMDPSLETLPALQNENRPLIRYWTLVKTRNGPTEKPYYSTGHIFLLATIPDRGVSKAARVCMYVRTTTHGAKLLLLTSPKSHGPLLTTTLFPLNKCACATGKKRHIPYVSSYSVNEAGKKTVYLEAG